MTREDIRNQTRQRRIKAAWLREVHKMTYKRIGEVMGVSTERARQIVWHGLHPKWRLTK